MYIYIYMYIIVYLVGGIVSTPLKNMTLSIGMMNFPIYGKIKNVPNHQPVMVHSGSMMIFLWFIVVHNHGPWLIMI